MKVAAVLAKLEASPEFSSWRAANPDAYLAHLFCMVEKEAASWQVGYYDAKTDAITSFDLAPDGVKAYPPEAVFKKEGAGVKELKMDAVKADVDDALEAAAALQRRKYPAELPIKKIVVLQTLPIGQVYNITYVTKGFKTLNIKVSAAAGEAVEDNIAAIFSFDKGGPEAQG